VLYPLWCCPSPHRVRCVASGRQDPKSLVLYSFAQQRPASDLVVTFQNDFDVQIRNAFLVLTAALFGAALSTAIANLLVWLDPWMNRAAVSCGRH
jgi:hypothetical protein